MYRTAGRLAVGLTVVSWLSACSGDEVDGTGTGVGGSSPGDGSPAATAADGAGAPPRSNADGCDGFELEPDFTPSPLDGPGVVDGGIPAGDYIISTTYLRLQPGDEPRAVFNALAADVVADLQARSGWVGLSLALSAECETARTLSVWESDEAMIDFATGDAHFAAVRRVGEISRGGSIAMHFAGSEAAATWEAAAEQLAGFDGRLY